MKLLNTHYFLQCIYLMSMCLLFSNTIFAGGEQIKYTQFERSIKDVFNNDDIEAENKIKVVFINKYREEDQTENIYINMNKEVLEKYFRPYNNESTTTISDICVTSLWKVISPRIIVGCFEYFFRYKAYYDTNTTYLREELKKIMTEVTEVFDKSINPWTRVIWVATIINTIIKDNIELKENILSEIISHLEYADIDFQDTNKLQETITSMNNLPDSNSNRTIKLIFKYRVEFFLHKLMIKAQETSNLVYFRTIYAELLKLYPRVLSGSVGTTLVVHPRHCDALGKPISEEIKILLAYYAEIGINDLDILMITEHKSIFNCSRILLAFCDKPLCEILAEDTEDKLTTLISTRSSLMADESIYMFIPICLHDDPSKNSVISIKKLNPLMFSYYDRSEDMDIQTLKCFKHSFAGKW